MADAVWNMYRKSGEWRQGRVGGKERRARGGITEYMDSGGGGSGGGSGGGEVGPQRTYCYNMENNMAEVGAVKVGPK
jgi:hypothetical protein